MTLKTSVSTAPEVGVDATRVRVTQGEHSTRVQATLIDGVVGYEFGIAPEPTTEQLRSLGAAVVDEASRAHLSEVAVSLPELDEEQLEEFVIGLLLAGYRFDTYRTNEDADSFCALPEGMFSVIMR